MNTTEMLELQEAIHKIQMVLNGRYGEHDFRLWGDPTDLGELSGAARGVVSRVDEASEASRERAAIYFCLSSAIVLLGVTQRLMSAPTNLSPKDRAERLRQLIEDLRTAARAAYRAGLLLLNVDPCLPWSAKSGTA